jgi:hypothetical protein
MKRQLRLRALVAGILFGVAMAFPCSAQIIELYNTSFKRGTEVGRLRMIMKTPYWGSYRFTCTQAPTGWSVREFTLPSAIGGRTYDNQSFNVETPESGGAGEVTIEMSYKPAGGSWSWFDEMTIAVTANESDIGIGDCALLYPATLAPTESLKALDFSVWNRGICSTEAAPPCVDIFISPDDVFAGDGNDVLLGSLALSWGGSADASDYWNIQGSDWEYSLRQLRVPSGTAAGNYRVFARCRHDDGVAYPLLDPEVANNADDYSTLLTIHERVQISGRVITEHGHGLSGARLRAVPVAGGLLQRQEFVTDSEGAYALMVPYGHPNAYGFSITPLSSDQDAFPESRTYHNPTADVLEQDYIYIEKHRALAVQSAEVSPVPVSLSVADTRGDRDGETTLVRIYDRGTCVQLSVPQLVYDSAGFPWQFDHWSGADTDSGIQANVCLSKSRSLVASYERWNHNLTIRSTPDTGVYLVTIPDDLNGEGAENGPLDRIYPHGTPVGVTAAATWGGRPFVGWSGASISTSRTANIVVDSEMEMTANYGGHKLRILSEGAYDVPVTISPADLSGHSGGETSFTRLFDYGTSVTITAPEVYAGLSFTGWKGDIASRSRSVTCTMSRDRDATASYEDLTNPKLAVTPSLFNHHIAEGESPSADVLTVLNAGDGYFSFLAWTSVDWLTVEPTEGSCASSSETVAVQYDTADMSPGNYSAYITVKAPRASGSPKQIPVTVNISEVMIPEIGVSTNFFRPKSTNTVFQCIVEGSDAEDQSFEVWNSGTGVLQYDVSTDVDWLTVSPASDSSAGEHDLVTITYNTADLLVENHPDGHIFITSPDCSSIVTVTVDLVILYPIAPVLFVYPSDIELRSGQGQRPDPVSLHVWNFDMEQRPLDYTVECKASWITSSKPSGTALPYEYDTVDLTYDTSAFAPGVYTGIVTVIANAQDSPYEVTNVVRVSEAGFWAWGLESYDLCELPWDIDSDDIREIVSGRFYNTVLLSDGTVRTWGDRDYNDVTNVPPGAHGAKRIVAGDYHCLALHSNGTVIAWGTDTSGQSSPPPGLDDIVDVAGGGWHNVALREDGTVVCWGFDGDGRTSPPEGLSGVAAVGAGYQHSLALLQNGTVVAWGRNDSSECDVPADLVGVIQVAGGHDYSAAVTSNGAVVVWGTMLATPAGLPPVSSIACGQYHVLARTRDERLFIWGWKNTSQQLDMPTELTNVTVMAVGDNHSVAISQPVNMVASPNAISVIEGSAATVDVSLSRRPLGSCQVSASPRTDDSLITSISPAVMTFTRENWGDSQPLSFSIEADDDAIRDMDDIVLTSAGLVGQAVRITAVETNVLALLVTPLSVEVVEGEAAEFSVSLSCRPAESIGIVTECPDAQHVIAGHVLTIPAEGWDSPQAISLQTLPDDDCVDAMVPIRFSSLGLETVEVSLTVVDTDELTLRAEPSELILREGSTAQVLLWLDAKPEEDVSIKLVPSEAVSGLELTPTSFVFTAHNWTNSQSFHVTGPVDVDAEDGELSLSCMLGSSTSSVVELTIRDRDRMELILAHSSIVVSEGAQTSLVVRASAQPLSPLSILAEAISGDGDIRVLPGAYALDSSNYVSGCEVDIAAAHDDDTENGICYIRFSAISLSSVTGSVTECDSDVLGVDISLHDIEIVEGDTVLVPVRLTASPITMATVTVERVEGDGDVVCQNGAGSLVFTPASWNVYQELQFISSQDDDAVDGLAVFSVSTPNATSARLRVREDDDDVLALHVTPDVLKIGEGSTGQVSVRLTAQPSTNARVTMARLDGDGCEVAGPSSPLSFGSSNWSNSQTVTILAPSDENRASETTVFRFSLDSGSIRDIAVGTEDADTGSFRILSTDLAATGAVHELCLRWQSMLGERYTVQEAACADGPFGIVESDIMPTPPMNTHTNLVTPVGPSFYRIVVSPE